MPKIIAIAGGSCSGKTTLAKKLADYLGADRSRILFQDSFYIDQSDKFDYDGGSVNFDHPEALDFALMAEQLKLLKSGQTVQIPIYDFATHKRKVETEVFEPKPTIIVDGTLILSQQMLRPLFDHSCFIECEYEARLQRRKDRDVKERGRSESGVIEQFTSQVEPMHKLFVEPSKLHAEKVYSQNCVSDLQFLEKLVTEWELL